MKKFLITFLLSCFALANSVHLSAMQTFKADSKTGSALAKLEPEKIITLKKKAYRVNAITQKTSYGEDLVEFKAIVRDSDFNYHTLYFAKNSNHEFLSASKLTLTPLSQTETEAFKKKLQEDEYLKKITTALPFMKCALYAAGIFGLSYFIYKILK
ncbi:MAG TPA: hypothetical protein VHO47_01800 [Candidatus Babeliales bacterium]|nr:hypothetical protein [Candidatus Babeliales bacterium]